MIPARRRPVTIMQVCRGLGGPFAAREIHVTRVRFRIDLAEGLSIGPGKIELLELLDREGSISAAARAMGISYRQAWVLLDSLNQGFGEPVFRTATGGRRGGGAHTTPFGRRLTARYRALEKSIERIARQTLGDLAQAPQATTRGVPPRARAGTSTTRRRLKPHGRNPPRSKRRP